MTNGTEDTPTTDELAKELAATEGTDSPETAPDPAAATTAQPEAPAAQADPPAPDPEPDPPGGDTEAERTIAPPLNTAQADKKAADTTRREATIAATPDADTTVQDEEDKRKAGIYEKLEAVQAELLEAQAAVDDCKAQARDLMAELYPHSAESDKLVDAVRGHIKAQKKIRATRASTPARIAEILKAAGRSPIDQAFHVQRARGMGRPIRSQVKPPGADKGDGSNANAGSE